MLINLWRMCVSERFNLPQREHRKNLGFFVSQRLAIRNDLLMRGMSGYSYPVFRDMSREK